MKKIITGFVIAMFAYIAFLPLPALAAGQQEVQLKTMGKQTEVTLSFPEDAVRENVYSLSLSLEITSEKETEAVFHFETGIAKIAEFRYSGENGRMNLYLSNGDKPLFAQNETVLKLGTLEVSDAGAEVALVTDSVKTVAGTEMENLQNVSGQVKPDGGDSGNTDNPGGGDGGNTDNPGGGDGGNTDNPDDGDGGDTDNPDDGSGSDTEANEEYLTLLNRLKETIAIAETYRESDYTAESFHVLKNALEEAKKKAEDSKVTMEEMQTALLNLENAIGGLVQNTISSEENNQKEPTDDGQDGQPQTGQAVNAKTGDSSNVILWIGVFAVSLGVLGYIIYRKKRGGK